MALLDEKAGVDEKTGCDPEAASRFSHVTEVNVSSSVSMIASSCSSCVYNAANTELLVNEGKG